MDRLAQNLRHAIARLVRDRGFAAITIVTLALGIGANTAVFSLVKATLLSPLPYGDADRLTAIWGPDRAETTHLSLREVYTYPRETQRFVGIAGYREADVSFTGGQEPELIRGGSATPNLFEVTRSSAMLGRTFKAADTAGGASNVIVISHADVRRREVAVRTALGAGEPAAAR
ncbi:MAG: ABC transporter permease [Cyanobacteria bacterium]|nr:ABC transporter permease [Cyanobacteriota bacterium]